jgi:hypothetical protein
MVFTARSASPRKTKPSRRVKKEMLLQDTRFDANIASLRSSAVC